jgi:hypothetical protein
VRPLHPNLRAGIAAKDPAIRTLVEAQSEARSDVLRTKADLQTADTFVARTADFTAANALVAAAQTVEAALASAPAANALYDPHFKVTINPIIPGVGTTSHKVVVAVETDPTGVGVWTEQYNFEYEVIKKVGELNTPIVWPSERMPVRVPGFTAAGKLRLKVKSASGPAAGRSASTASTWRPTAICSPALPITLGPRSTSSTAGARRSPTSCSRSSAMR